MLSEPKIDPRIERYKNVTNLQAEFGKRYKVRDDGTGDPDRIEKIWSMEIPHETGSIYPCGFNGDLAVWTRSRRINSKLKALGFLSPSQGTEYASESSWRFNVSKLDEVAVVVKPRKRRQISPEQREKLIERLKNHQLRVRSSNSKPTFPL